MEKIERGIQRVLKRRKKLTLREKKEKAKADKQLAIKQKRVEKELARKAKVRKLNEEFNNE